MSCYCTTFADGRLLSHGDCADYFDVRLHGHDDRADFIDGCLLGHDDCANYYGSPFGPACYDPFFGAAPWASDPYMYYVMPYGGGYTNVPAPAGYHDGCHGRKRMADGEHQRHGEAGFKRRCGGRSEVAF